MVSRKTPLFFQESLELLGCSEKGRLLPHPGHPPTTSRRKKDPSSGSFSLPLSSHAHSSHSSGLLPLSPQSSLSSSCPPPTLSPSLSDLCVEEKSELKSLPLNSLQVNWMILKDVSGQQDFPD